MTNAKPVMPDVAQVRLSARAEWEKKMRQRTGIHERIAYSVPWWLVLIAAVFYLLSAPHTAGVFNLLTPGWGWVAPLGVEFATLFVAWRRYQLKHQNEKATLTLNSLGILAVGIAVVVNGAGALDMVVHSTNLNSLSFAQIANQFGTLPITTQVGLLLVPLAAVVIPLGTLVAGEGLAALILERREHGDHIEQEWINVRVQIEFQALFNAAVQSGISPRQAELWAGKIAAAALPVPQELETTDKALVVQTVQDVQTPLQRCINQLNIDTAAQQMTIREFADKMGVSIGTAHAAFKLFKRSKDVQMVEQVDENNGRTET